MPSEARLPAKDRPLATVTADHGRRIIASADGAARALGVTPGMTLTRARASAADLVVADLDPDADLAGLERLALWAARRYTPSSPSIRPTACGSTSRAAKGCSTASCRF